MTENKQINEFVKQQESVSLNLWFDNGTKEFFVDIKEADSSDKNIGIGKSVNAAIKKAWSVLLQNTDVELDEDEDDTIDGVFFEQDVWEQARSEDYNDFGDLQ